MNIADQKLTLMKAEQGDVEAQFTVAFYFLNGEGGFSQDNNKAYEWFLKAAEQGYAPAQCNVGYCFQNGIGVEKDEKKATAWFLKAAEQGEPQAQFNLGNCFYYGLGVEKDLQQTHEWYSKAAENGNADAQYGLGYFFTLGMGVKQDSKIAYEWLLKAAKQDHADAQALINHTYWYTSGVKRNIKKVVDDQPGVQTRDKKLTINDAYDAMYDFLDEYNANLKESLNDDISCMLGSMSLVTTYDDIMPIDKALWLDWLDSIEKILKQQNLNLHVDEIPHQKLTITEAYAAMLDYLQEYFLRGNSSSLEIKTLIDSMILIKPEESTDPLMWQNWLDLVAKVVKENPRKRPFLVLYKDE